MANSKPPLALLWEKYSYSPFTGRFYRKIDGREIKGNSVGYGRSHQLSINSKYRFPYGVCVYAWLFGEWPGKGEEIDHIDHDAFNHSPWNIRKVPKEENLKNRRRVGTFMLRSEKILRDFNVSEIPESLRDHLKLDLPKKKKPAQKEVRYVKLSTEQALAIHKLNWPAPIFEIRKILPSKGPFKCNQTFSSPVYNSVVSAIHEKPIHIGDVAILWLALISDDYPIHSISYFYRRLASVARSEIIVSDGYISLGKKIDEL